MMRTTVTLDDDIYEAAQGVSRFPVFEVPADARMIPASRVQKALDEEGIA